MFIIDFQCFMIMILWIVVSCGFGPLWIIIFPKKAVNYEMGSDHYDSIFLFVFPFNSFCIVPDVLIQTYPIAGKSFYAF
jgi:hypothetical protein